MNAFKTFEKFEDGAKEIAAFSATIANALRYSADIFPADSFDATRNLLKLVYDNPPTIYDEDFPRSKAITVKAYETGYRCPGHLAFGWKIIDNNGKTEYSFRVTVNNTNAFARNTSVMKAAKELGWKIVEADERGKKIEE